MNRGFVGCGVPLSAYAAVFGREPAARQLAEAIEAGCITINEAQGSGPLLNLVCVK